MDGSENAQASSAAAAESTRPSAGVLQQLYEQQQIFGYHSLRARQAHQFYSELCAGLPVCTSLRHLAAPVFSNVLVKIFV